VGEGGEGPSGAAYELAPNVRAVIDVPVEAVAAGSEEVAARYLGMPADAARGDGDTEELARRLRAFLG